MGDADYMYAFLNLVMPIAYEFAPELVFSKFAIHPYPYRRRSITSRAIVSAGFDAAAGDNLGMCDVTPACYAHMTALLGTLAGGKLVVALEASYLFILNQARYGFNLRGILDSRSLADDLLLNPPTFRVDTI